MNYLDTTATQVIKKRFKETRDELRSSINLTYKGFADYVTKIEPQYHSPLGHERMKNTWYGKYADMRLLELIQELNNN